MKIPFTDLGAVGVVADLPNNELPLNAWTSCRNFCFRDGFPEKVKGYREVYASPTVAPEWLLPVPDGNTYYWVYPADTFIYQTEGSSHSNITRSSGNYTASSYAWTGGVLGGLPILNNGVDAPQKWNIGGLCEDLANWNFGSYTDNTARIIRPFGQRLIAMDVTLDDGTAVDYPYRVMWSHPAEPGQEPSSWDFTDTSKRAGFFDLMEGSDKIIDGLPLRDAFIVYKQNSTWIMRFTGGNEVYSFDRIFSEHGLLATRCVKPFGDGWHFAVTTGDVIIHNGNEAKSIADKRVRELIFSEIDTANFDKCFVTPNYQESEMWFCYPNAGNSRSTRAAIWNIESGAWGFRDLPEVNHIGYGIVDDANTGQVIDGMTNAIDTYTDPIDGNAYNPTVLNLMMATSSKFYEVAGTQASGQDINATLEKVGIDAVMTSKGLSSDSALFKRVNAVWPRTTAPVKVSIGVSDTPNGNYSWSPERDFDPSTDYKVDFRATGRFLGVRFTSTDSNLPAIESFDVEYEPAGYR